MELLEKKQFKIFFMVVMLLSIDSKADFFYPVYYKIRSSHIKEKEILSDSLVWSENFFITTTQTHNNSLKKHQKKSKFQFLADRFQSLQPGLAYEQNSDKSKNYNQLESKKSLFYFDSGKSFFSKSVLFKMKNGYQVEKHEYKTQQEIENIKNDGMVHNSELEWNQLGMKTNVKADYYHLSRTPYWIGSAGNESLTNIKGANIRSRVGLNKGHHVYPRLDFDEVKTTLSHYGGLEIFYQYGRKSDFLTEIVLDSLEKNSYYDENNRIYKERKNRYFKELFNWKYKIHSDFIVDLKYSFLKDQVSFRNRFNSYIYKNYLGQINLFWSYKNTRLIFNKVLEKDYFHYRDSLNFNDNDLLRDYTNIKAEVGPFYKNYAVNIELTNQKKKMVYISKYLSSNNYFEDNYKVTIEMLSPLSERFSISNGIRLEAEYLFYEYDPEQNSLLRIFEHEFSFQYQLGDNYYLTITNQIRNRDNGLYEDRTSRYLYYKEKKRIRQLLNWELKKTGKELEFDLFVLYADNNYYLYTVKGIEKSKQDKEFSGGLRTRLKETENRPYSLYVTLEKKHYYGYRYWVARLDLIYHFH